MRRSRRAVPAGVHVAAALVLLAVLTAGVLHSGFVRDVDWRVHLFVAAHLQGDLAHALSGGAARLGQRGVVVVPLLGLAALAARRQRSIRPLLVTVAMLAGVALVVWLFKAGVGRVAPGTGHDAVHAGGWSYPSGHAVNALVCWALVLEFAASLGPGPARLLPVRRRRLVTAALAVAAGTGMTTLDYHWLTDTIAGWLLGGLILAGVLAVGPVQPGRRQARLSRSAPQAPARPAPSA